jgi:hypothetical protein
MAWSCKTAGPDFMIFNEDSRVKIPALLHLTRLGYKECEVSVGA